MHDLKEIATRIAGFINEHGGSVHPEDITLEQLAAVCYIIGVRPAIEVVAREVETEPMTTMGELAKRTGEPRALAKNGLTDIEKAAVALLDAIDMRPEGYNVAPNAEFARWSNRIYAPCVRELKRLVTETTGVPYK